MRGSSPGIYWMVLAAYGCLALEEVTVKLHREVPGKFLSCYVCETSENCITLANKTDIEKRKCELHESFCKVEKLTHGDTIRLKRSCARKCDPGCVRVMDKERCVGCCVTSYCNIGNGATDVHHAATTTTLLLTSFIVCITSRQ